jgi:hypothetical protein
LALENVLNQIIAVFSGDDGQQEELAAVMASAEQSDSRNGYRQNECSPSNQNRIDLQGLAKIQDTLEKIYKMVYTVKSEVGNVGKSANHDCSGLESQAIWITQQ